MKINILQFILYINFIPYIKSMLPDWYNQYKNFIEKNIKTYLDTYFWTKKNKWGLENFKEAIIYSLQWWKRIRAILALELYLSLSKDSLEDIVAKQNESGKLENITKYCIALECVHAYSLVHDDLPCMDNDTLRRWQETTWKKFWEYQWVLVWDALQSLSFEIISEITDPYLSTQLSNLLSKSVGFYGMLWWQIDDLYFEEYSDELRTVDLIRLHNRKTGALIKASIQGGILVSGKIKYIHKLSHFWEKLWLAFQIKDDLLDVEWTVQETGKSVGWEKKWFVHFFWIKKTQKELRKIIKECLVSVKTLKSDHLKFMVWYVGKWVK